MGTGDWVLGLGNGLLPDWGLQDWGLLLGDSEDGLRDWGLELGDG